MNRPRSHAPPLVWALGGFLAGGAVLGVQLAAREKHSRSEENRPLSAESTAERFLSAWSSGQLRRARELSHGPALGRLSASPVDDDPKPFGADIAIQFTESHRIDGRSLMLAARVDVQGDTAEQRQAQIIVSRHEGRWFVEEVTWLPQ